MHFYQRNTFVYLLNLLNFNGMFSVNTSLNVKSCSTIKHLSTATCLYESIQLLKLSVIFATRLSPQAVYFIQTGSCALSGNTYT